MDCVLIANVLLYADDTVLYFAGKDVGIIERTLARELEEVARYLDENELVINLKEGKTEVMLFGTAKRLSWKNRKLSIKYRGREINVTKEYTYLGYTLDNTLKLNGCFNIAYRKYCNRLELLSKLRHYLTTDAATKIFQSMILPVVTYSGLLKLQFTRTQLGRIQSIERRAKNIICPQQHSKVLATIVKIIHKQSGITVRKCQISK